MFARNETGRRYGFFAFRPLSRQNAAVGRSEKTRPPRVDQDPVAERERREGIANRLRQARMDKKWSYHDLAASCGLTAEGIRQIESGRRDPSTGTLVRLAKSLGVSEVWLLIGDSQQTREPAAAPDTGGTDE